MASRLAPATTDGPGPTGHAPASGLTTQELEVIAHLGWYALDVASGRWVSSPGLDTIFGIDSAFDRSVDGWASLIHEADREAMLAYLSDEVLSARHPFDRRYRIVRADTGEERWVHGRGTLELDTRGQPRTMLGAIVDITEAQLAHDALTQSERRYRTIFEGASEAILIAEVATGRFRWVNHAARGLFGYTTEEFERLTAEDIHPPETWRAVRDVFLGQGDGQQTLARAVPCRKKDGSRLVVDIKSSTAILDGVLCNVGFFTDVTQLLRLQGQQRKLGQAMDQAGEGILITGPTAVVEYANPAFEQLVGRSASQMSGRGLRLFGTPIDPAMVRSMWNALTRGEPWNGDIAFRRRDGMERIAATSIAPVHDADGGLVGYVCVARDVTDETASRAERERLAAVVEQTSDSVVIADLQGTIEYVNAAFERVSGYARDEVIGHNPRILKSGMQSVDFYRAMWRRLAGGDRWTGTLINRRKDGELYEEEATISPIRGPGGDVVAYVAVKRDVTALRAAETNLERQLRERGEVTAALSRLTPQATPEQTGSEICDALLELPGVDVGVIFTFHRPGHAVPLAVSGPSGLPVTPGQSLPAARAAYLYDRAEQGPWAEAWRARPEDGEYGERMVSLGFRAVAYAPIRDGGGLIGLLGIGTRDEAYAPHLIAHLPVVGEFAATASALLSVQLERERRDGLARARIAGVLDDGAFGPVFQPIVALDTGTVVGFEALTRFADGTPPDQVIGDAHVVGLGPELELACLVAALRASAALSSGCWLSLNLSPEALLHPSNLAELLARRHSGVVIEITEHSEILDYPAVRRRLAELGPTVSLAVDDAGAGFASLRHVVELQPQYLKLDVAMTRNVDRDAARQAMIAGLAHFAARVGCDVIAEGIERPGELAMLRMLGVTYGQGFLLGRPAPVQAAACGVMSVRRTRVRPLRDAPAPVG